MKTTQANAEGLRLGDRNAIGLLLKHTPRTPARSWGQRLTGIAAWTWRISVGAVLCFNVFFVSILTSVVATGWTFRWMRLLILRGWARQVQAETGDLPPRLPGTPNWFVQEDLRAALHRPGADGKTASKLRVAARALIVPWHALWLNFKAGVKGLLAAALLTASGCLLMMFGWEFGWLNSFHRGYEIRLIHPLSMALGAILLAAGLVFVPLAQAHQAVTGSFWAFFDLRFLTRLIRIKLGTYTALALGVFLLSMALEGIKMQPGNFDQLYPWTFREQARYRLGILVPQWLERPYTGLYDASDAEVYRTIELFFLQASFVLFPCLLLVRGLSAVIYRSAVLHGLRSGQLSRNELHPTVAAALARLPIAGVPAASFSLLRAVRSVVRLAVRPALVGLLFLSWALFAAKPFGFEFFVYHPGEGVLNHMLIHFPCYQLVPPWVHCPPPR
jgi:hypothetical protein